MEPLAEEFVHLATKTRESHHTRVEEFAQSFPTSFVATTMQRARTEVATLFDDTDVAEEEVRVAAILRSQYDHAIDRMTRSMLTNLNAKYQAELVLCKMDLDQIATPLDTICTRLKEGTAATPELSMLMSATLTGYIDSAESRIKAFEIPDKLHVLDIMMLVEFEVIQLEIGISELTMGIILDILIKSIPVPPDFDDTL